MLATSTRAGVRLDGERLRFGGASKGEETGMETDPSSAPSPSPSSSHAPFASAKAAGARPQLAMLALRRKKVLESLTAWPHPAREKDVEDEVMREGHFKCFHWLGPRVRAGKRQKPDGRWTEWLGRQKKVSWQQGAFELFSGL